jgi:predicted nucleotidyltransferase
MIYSDQQFERFSKPPFKYERQQVIDTHTEIRTAINNFYKREEIKVKYNLNELPVLDIFLQGSYANDTNISKSSDVDIVVKINNIWRADKSSLSPQDLERYNSSTRDTEYTFNQFNSDIMSCIQRHFGVPNVTNDIKCLKLRSHSNFCDADIIPSFTYKLFGTYTSTERQNFTDGIVFDTNDGKMIINYPKSHLQFLSSKSGRTSGNFKETVRMFKNLKNELVDNGIIHQEAAKSYYIENLIFNVPDNLFSGTYKDRFTNILQKLIDDFNLGAVNNYYCANGIDRLISDSSWSIDSLRSFLEGLILIQDKTSYQ